MMYTVALYLITSTSEIYLYPKYSTFSPYPIIECTGMVRVDNLTGEKAFEKVCQTERLFYFMTGIDTYRFTTTGAYSV
jgi:hypothetical protein